MLSRISLIFLSLLMLSFSTSSNAQTKVVFCESCSSNTILRVALQEAQSGQRIGVGDRRTGNLAMFRVGSKTIRGFSINPEAATQKEQDEFFAYSDAYRQRGRAGYIGMEIRLSEAGGAGISSALMAPRDHQGMAVAAVAPPEGAPGKQLSGFDVVKDGPLRQRFLAWASDVSNWPGLKDPLSFYAKLIVSTGKSLYTGADFQIGATFYFRDGSYAITYYSSSSQRLQISEVRDSVGNLIFTDSKEEVSVDYTNYMWPEAFLRADYARGIDFLWSRGAMAPNGEVKRGTVLVKDVVIVRDEK